MKYVADYTLQFDCGRTTGGRWVAICDTLPGIRSRRATEEAALREAAALGLRVIAELVAKGDPHWTRFKKANV